MVSRLCFALVGVLNRFVVLWKFITKHLFLALGITTIIFFFGEFDCPFLGHLNPVNPKLFPRLSEHLRYLHYRRVHWSPLYKKCRLFSFYSISNETSLWVYIIYNYTFILKNLFCYKYKCMCLKTGVYQRSFSVSIIHLSLTWHLLQIYVFVLILW